MNVNDMKKNKRRKRTMNTTREQYEIYLDVIESDYILRSGTINPTLGENNFSEKWEELTNKLNAIGNGPNLTTEEWKKRFTDWKYATKNKYRKISGHREGTESGPKLDIIITDLEKRALCMWEQVTVTENKQTKDYEELETANNTTFQNTKKNKCNGSNRNIACINISEELNIDNNTLKLENKNNNEVGKDTNNTLFTENGTVPYETNANIIIPVAGTSGKLTKQQIHHKTPNPCKETVGLNKTNFSERVKQLPVLTEKLIEINKEYTSALAECNSVLSKYTENYINIKQEEIKLEKTKLRLEIAKIKIGHPEFQFDV